MSRLTIGGLAARTGLSVRTVRFYADAGVVPEVARSEAGYRLFDREAVAQLRFVRTLRELGVGLDDIRRVLTDQVSLADVAATHAAALDAQIRTLKVHRAVLGVTATTEERRRMLDDYLDHVFEGREDPVADKFAMGAPELPDDPTPEQVEAWVELATLLRDPDFRAVSKAMADRAAASDAPAPDMTIGRDAAAALEAGVDPASPEALAIVERVGPPEDRRAAAEHIEAFTDRRVGRYWELVGIVNGWPPQPDPVPAYAWFAQALRASSVG